MLSSVKNQMSGWLSMGVPGLRKGGELPAEIQDTGKPEAVSPASEKSVKGSPVEQKDDDDYR